MSAVDPTRSLDLEHLSLEDALELAALVEEEARDRYEELASQMELHHNPEAAAFFRHMLSIEALHAAGLKRVLQARPPHDPSRVRRSMLFDVEAPDYGEVRAGMTVRDALQVARHAENKAEAFFDKALTRVNDPAVRDLFTSLRDQERAHEKLVLAQMAKLPPPGALEADDVEDEPVAQ